MNLSCLLTLLKDIPDYRRLREGLLKPLNSDNRLMVSDTVRPYVIATLHQELGLPVLVVTAQPESAKSLYDQLQVWCSSSTLLRFFPETEFLADDFFNTDTVTTTERSQVLSILCQDALHYGYKPPLIVSSALAAASKTMNCSEFAAASHTLEVGASIDPFHLVKRWQDMGYELENIVEVPGTISRRGGIVDIFSPNNDLPTRIEFSGNRVDSIRLFDPKTQRSSKIVQSTVIIPTREGQIRNSNCSILDYLPAETLLIIDDLDEIRAITETMTSEAQEFQQKKDSKQISEFVDFCLSWPEFEAKIKRIKQRLVLHSWNLDNSGGVWPQVLPLAPVPSFGGRLDVFSQALNEMIKEERRVIIVSQQTNRLSELLQERGILAHSVSQLEQVPQLKSITLVQGSVAEGWALKGILTLLTDKEIFGLVKERRLSRKRPIKHHCFVSGLVTGDYVVHIEHGIARFVGLTKMSAEGSEREYLVLEYAAGDRLYVPTDQVDRVSRYIGAGDQPPTLSRLGTQEWSRTKQRIKESVAEIAGELLNLYAAREVVPGFAFSPDNLWQQELESSFPYLETHDQLEAVQAVKADMEKPRPMDRLVCGDVGYGKTEVALRAAFKAVMDSKQVALLVPTTVLAQQHFVTFSERLQAFPVKVEVLSRFCTEKEQASVIEGLAVGTVDICIGTHRMLQKDVKFKDLGLIIIDEEQRFGVVHKEHFKKMRRELDILTLSATPIPRTLHMSLAGIRDMSTIETPPEERLPIKTYVGAYEDGLVREAVLRELERNGQVFFVHNRVHSIVPVATKLCSLVPEARISVAHGQMAEVELERVMSEFARHKSDVLVTTTIIESGLDMPNVNTLIVDQADKFGLTQLYQLRGRVGRGGNNAYAYFLFDRGRQLTTEARKRLTTIYEAAELGAGFGIAMRDLEIRGAGNLLGVEQSGYIVAVGFDLYCRLLAEAVEELRQDRTGKRKGMVHETPSPAVSLPIAAHIPEEYVSDLSTRISFYERLAAIKRVEEVDYIAQEMNDRFGIVPKPVENIFYIIKLKQLAAEAMVGSISTDAEQVVLHFNGARRLGKLAQLEGYRDRIKVGSRQIRLDIKKLGTDWQEVLREILQAMSMDN